MFNLHLSEYIECRHISIIINTIANFYFGANEI